MATDTLVLGNGDTVWDSLGVDIFNDAPILTTSIDYERYYLIAKGVCYRLTDTIRRYSIEGIKRLARTNGYRLEVKIIQGK